MVQAVVVQAVPVAGETGGEETPEAVRKKLLELVTCDDLRVPLRTRGLRVTGLKAELVERLLRDSSGGLTEEAATALHFVGRRCGSRPDGSALMDDTSAYVWIRRALQAQSRGQPGPAVHSGVKHRTRGSPTQ